MSLSERLAITVAAVLMGLTILRATTGPPGAPASANPPTVSATSPATTLVSLPAQSGRVVVDVQGAVESPGVYDLEPGSRVGAAIQAAGGFTADARVQGVNQAQLLRDGEMVRVPYNSEEKEPERLERADPMPMSLNLATVADLDRIEGIGPSIAAKIVEYRNLHGPFESWEQVDAIEDIGEARLTQLQAWFFLD